MRLQKNGVFTFQDTGDSRFPVCDLVKCSMFFSWSETFHGRSHARTWSTSVPLVMFDEVVGGGWCVVQCVIVSVF